MFNCKLYKDKREGDISAKLTLNHSFSHNHRKMVGHLEIPKPDRTNNRWENRDSPLAGCGPCWL